MDAALVIHYIGMVLHPSVILSLVLFSAFVISLVKVVNGTNDLEWWHFIATRGVDGKQYADIDKLGKCVGIVVASWVVIVMVYRDKMDAGILGVFLGYVGAIAAYSANLRARAGLPPAGDSK